MKAVVPRNVFGKIGIMRVIVPAALMALVLGACSHTKLTDWDKPGVALNEFNADTASCQREAEERAPGTLEAFTWRGVYNMCMEARGYSRLF